MQHAIFQGMETIDHDLSGPLTCLLLGEKYNPGNWDNRRRKDTKGHSLVFAVVTDGRKEAQKMHLLLLSSEEAAADA